MFNFINNKFEENTFANLVSLVGFYESYRNSHIGPVDKSEFTSFYNEQFCKDGVHYRTQKRANEIAYSHFRNKKIKCKKNKFKRYYRYKIKQNPQMDNAFYPFFEYIMNYIFEHDELKEIAINQISSVCSNYTAKIVSPDPYEHCVQNIYGNLYQKIADRAYSSISSTENREKANTLLKSLKDYARFDEFMKLCRVNHT